VRSAPHDEGRPDEECNFPFSKKYSPSRPKYFCTTGVFSFPTKFILLLGVVILLVYHLLVHTICTTYLATGVQPSVAQWGSALL